MCVYLYVDFYAFMQGHIEARKGVGSTGAGVIDGWEIPNTVSGN